MRLRVLVTVAATVGVVASAGAQTVNVHPGKYELTMTMEMDNGGTPMKDLTASLVAADKAAGECKLSDLKTTGNTISFTRTCGATGAMKSEYTYSGDTFAGMSERPTGQGKPVTTRLTAKRVGDCAK